MTDTSVPESEELRILASAVERAIAEGCEWLGHLSTPLGREVYRHKADLIASLELPGKKILDWGSGFGQMSHLLGLRGFDAAAYTIDPETPTPWNLFFREGGLNVVYGEDPVRLPFEDGSFDAVLSCGVLEHVEDEGASLGEVARILPPGGAFIVMMLPNRWSWTEFLARHFLDMPFHDRLYTMGSMKRLLAGHGFRAEKTWRWNSFPKNLVFLPEGFRRRATAHPDRLIDLDRALSGVPPFSWMSGVVEGLFIKN